MSFSERLVLLRTSRNLTQKQVYESIGMSAIGYQRYEYDKREPGVRTALRIARALDSTVEELFGAATPDTEKTPDGNPAK